MNDVKIKQQIVEKIKNSTNILVTVSTDPSVDALSAALGLTVMLNKLDKHATAVFSGTIPPAITFLDPEKTFEATTDSLRDFIIALDKEKADHLRYKVDGDVVKIFITPYRTTITNEDLEFSQGDYNVELVLALGVDNQDHLDNALEAHGRILHDATVATISAGEQASSLGNLDWRDEQASSLSEMLVSLGDALKSDKPILDKQISTALLTGIVAATDRFSNTRTSSKVMTVAAQLMAAGADQQLIAAKLQESHEIGTLKPPVEQTSDGTAEIQLSDDKSIKLEKTDQEPVKPADGGLAISHEKSDKLDEVADEVKVKNQEDAADVAEQVLADHIEAATTSTVTPQLVTELDDAAKPDQAPRGAVDWAPSVEGEPSLGGTLNATTEQAEEDTRRQLADDQNKTILTHSYLNESPVYNAPINGATQPSDEADVDIFSSSPNTPPPVVDTAAPSTNLSAPVGPTLADIDKQNRDGGATQDDALAAVHATFDGQGGQPFTPTEPGVTLPLPPPLPDFSTMSPPAPSAYALEPEASPTERLGDIFPPQTAAPDQPPSGDNDPGQFKIPGQ
ncbi:hypothetical protein H7X68_01615 [Candidatus Saccharibacteria bacterium]|nr:hypothetical protein [Candidatus Saccharibacteria bacterium]